MNQVACEHFARVRRPWRWAFGLYVLALTTGTHWPQLVIGPAVPASDKFIHALAFGGLTFLLWRTGWVRSRRLVCAIGLAWVVTDELSQSIPGLGRYVTIEDIIASSLGVTIVGCGLLAFAPVGDGGTQRRLDAVALAFDELFARPSTWALAGLHLLACALPIAIVALAGPTQMAANAIGISAFAWAVSGLAILAGMWRGSYRRLGQAQACLTCAAPASRLPELRRTTCAACGAEVRSRDWAPARRTRMPWAEFATILLVVPATFGVAMLVIYGITSGWARANMQGTSPGVTGLVRWVSQLPADMVVVADLAVLLAAQAAALHWIFRHSARRDDQHERCRQCGHDLLGTPTVDGRGRCGECGLEFTDEGAA